MVMVLQRPERRNPIELTSYSITNYSSTTDDRRDGGTRIDGVDADITDSHRHPGATCLPRNDLIRVPRPRNSPALANQLMVVLEWAYPFTCTADAITHTRHHGLSRCLGICFGQVWIPPQPRQLYFWDRSLAWLQHSNSTNISSLL